MKEIEKRILFLWLQLRIIARKIYTKRIKGWNIAAYNLALFSLIVYSVTVVLFSEYLFNIKGLKYYSLNKNFPLGSLSMAAFFVFFLILSKVFPYNLNAKRVYLIRLAYKSTSGIHKTFAVTGLIISVLIFIMALIINL